MSTKFFRSVHEFDRRPSKDRQQAAAEQLFCDARFAFKTPLPSHWDAHIPTQNSSYCDLDGFTDDRDAMLAIKGVIAFNNSKKA